MLNISIAMTTYNGEKYLAEQIESILIQLKENDELIISDDGSTDDTIDILKKIVSTEKKVRYLNGPQMGCESNFQFAIENCRNEIILLCDQDDIWIPRKLEIIRSYFSNNPKTYVVVHDAFVIDSFNRIKHTSLFSLGVVRRGVVQNIYKSVFFGCCMGFRREFIKVILPFPSNIPLHDIWIAILGEGYKTLDIIDEKLIYYRRHENNLSKKSNIYHQIKNRFMITFAYIERRFKNESIKK